MLSSGTACHVEDTPFFLLKSRPLGPSKELIVTPSAPPSG